MANVLSRARGFGLFFLALCVIVGVLPGVAQEGEGITIQIDQSAGNPGRTVEVPVDLRPSRFAPATMILWFGYDAAQLTPDTDYYELITRDGQGNPVTDDAGEIITSRSAVRADFSLAEGGKAMTVAHHPDAGAIAVSFVGLGATQAAIPEGPLLTLAFRVSDDAPLNLTLAVLGHDASAPVLVEGVERRSSASDSEGAIAVDMRDGGVFVGCTAPPLTDNVTASQDRADGVLVAWEAVNSGVHYRVYRAETDDVSAAFPLGEGWQLETTFLDITAMAGAGSAPSACAGAPPVAGPTYYYWVASRDAFGCEHPPAGDGVAGTRGGAKILAAGLGTLGLICALLTITCFPRVWSRQRKRLG